MISISVRRALIGMTVAAAVVAFTIPVALAQPAPAANPVCGSVAGLMNHTLTKYTGGANGRNLVAIQRVSPINASPDNAANNGFQKICTRMGLPAPPSGDANLLPSIDGDATPDNAQLLQFDPTSGTVQTYLCNQPIASSNWDEGSGVEIRPTLSNNAVTSVPLITPGVECSQRYAAYNRGTNLFSIPLSTTCTDRVCLCGQLNLPATAGSADTAVTRIDAAAGVVDTFLCSQALDTNPPPVGEAVQIVPSVNARPNGAPVNCLSASNPCPSTPSNDYPAPLIY